MPKLELVLFSLTGNETSLERQSSVHSDTDLNQSYQSSMESCSTNLLSSSEAAAAGAASFTSCSDDVTLQQLTEEEERTSLLSAVEDGLRTKLVEEFSKTEAELECLQQTNFDLLDNQEDIERISQQLDDKLKVRSFENTDLCSTISPILSY